jgi:hypothetical protein
LAAHGIAPNGRDLHVSVLRHATDRDLDAFGVSSGIDAHAGCVSTHGKMGFQRNSGCSKPGLIRIIQTDTRPSFAAGY